MSFGGPVHVAVQYIGKVWPDSARSGKTAPVSIDLRRVTDDEFPAYARAIATAFGGLPDEQLVADWRATMELDRTIAAFDGSEVVGTAGAYSFELTLPGGGGEPAAGVTVVGVRPTHRRQGLLRRMMQHQLDDVVERGESLMVLTASEGAIYERFGYGAAVFASSWTLRTDALELARPSTAGGRMRMVDIDEARKLVPGIFDRARTRHVGAVTRSDAHWDTVFADRPADRRRRSWFTVVHESSAGEPDGFVLYKVEQREPDGGPQNSIVVIDLDALDAEVEAALWDYLVHVDLVVSIRTENRPVDEPLRWRLADQRRVHVDGVHDHLWVRIVDPAVALSARRYGTDDALVLEIADAFRPDNDGRWLVDGGPEGATAARTDRAPDLSLSAPELGSIFLGGVSPSTLARAGRVRGLTSGALARADAFFSTQPAPWCATHF
jgi:predicted acetyltransferase